MGLEEWDRIHTLLIVSFVRDDSPGEVEIGMAIRRVVIDVEEGFEEHFVPWGVDARTGMYIIPIVLYPPVEDEVEVEEDGEGKMVEVDWSVTSEVWDRETV